MELRKLIINTALSLSSPSGSSLNYSPQSLIAGKQSWSSIQAYVSGPQCSFKHWTNGSSCPGGGGGGASPSSPSGSGNGGGPG